MQLLKALAPRRHLTARLKSVAGPTPQPRPWCAHVAVALATGVSLAQVADRVGTTPMRPADVAAFLRSVGRPPAILSGAAFALCAAAHRERTDGPFRAIGIDLRLDPDTQLGHAVYLEDDWMVDPATYAVTRATATECEHLAYVIIPQPRSV